MKLLAEGYRFLSFSLAKNPLEANIGVLKVFEMSWSEKVGRYPFL
jgi:hypothetical protein